MEGDHSTPNNRDWMGLDHAEALARLLLPQPTCLGAVINTFGPESDATQDMRTLLFDSTLQERERVIRFEHWLRDYGFHLWLDEA